MNIETLLKSSINKQLAWLESYHPDHRDTLDWETATENGAVVTGLEALIEDQLSYPESYSFADVLSASHPDVVNEARVDEIYGGATLTDLELKLLRDIILGDELNNVGGTHAINWVSFQMLDCGEDQVCAVYFGLVEGQGGYNPEPYGIFANLEVAIEKLAQDFTYLPPEEISRLSSLYLI